MNHTRTMKITHLFAGLLLLAATGPLYAADNQPAVDRVDSSFVQTRSLPGFSKPLVSHGILRFDRQHGFLWEITAPYHYTFHMNGDSATETLPDGTVRHLNPDQTPWLAAVEHIFVSALAGDTTDLQRYFNVKITPHGKSRQVQLTPRPGAIAQAIDDPQIEPLELGQGVLGQVRRAVVEDHDSGRRLAPRPVVE